MASTSVSCFLVELVSRSAFCRSLCYALIARTRLSRAKGYLLSQSLVSITDAKAKALDHVGQATHAADLVAAERSGCIHNRLVFLPTSRPRGNGSLLWVWRITPVNTECVGTRVGKMVAKAGSWYW